jgi:hypothetical protein
LATEAANGKTGLPALGRAIPVSQFHRDGGISGDDRYDSSFQDISGFSPSCGDGCRSLRPLRLPSPPILVKEQATSSFFRFHYTTIRLCRKNKGFRNADRSFDCSSFFPSKLSASRFRPPAPRRARTPQLWRRAIQHVLTNPNAGANRSFQISKTLFISFNIILPHPVSGRLVFSHFS